MTLRLITLGTLMLTGGCATGAYDGGQALAADHPANPGAASAPEPPHRGTLALGAAAALPATRPVAVTGAYVCPMHPDVTSDRPGTCPKCEMKLVPRAAGNAAPATRSAPDAAYGHHDHDGGRP